MIHLQTFQLLGIVVVLLVVGFYVGSHYQQGGTDIDSKNNIEESRLGTEESGDAATEKNVETVPTVGSPNPPAVFGGIEIYDGVSYGTDTKVIDLSGKGFTGSLKAEVRMLTNLVSLDLSDNNFTGLPAEVGQLSNLQILDLSNNQFTGLPHELGNLKNLQVLNLRGNAISEFDLTTIRNTLPSSAEIYTD